MQSRINIAKGPTRFSSTNNAGFKHVLDRHYDPLKNSGQFTITPEKLKRILSTNRVINTPVKKLAGGNYERVVNINTTIGTVKQSIPKVGGKSTTYLMVITDKAGNLVTTYPIPKP